jgi:hypothetical protein
MKAQWHERDPETGEMRYYQAELFGREWQFKKRQARRGIWKRISNPTRRMWEEVLDLVERNYARSLATPEQVATVKKVLSELPPPKVDVADADSEATS